MKTDFLIADTHFSHEGIAKSRGFSSAEYHDNAVIDAINSACPRSPYTRLFILGDFGGGDRPGRYRSRIECKEVWLIYGNHDKRSVSTHFSMCKDSYLLKTGVPSCPKLFLSHYPMCYWNGSHKGWGHAYGHVHAKREATMDEMMPERRSMDVSVDNLMNMFQQPFPISVKELAEIFAKRAGHDDIQYYRDNFGPLN